MDLWMGANQVVHSQANNRLRLRPSKRQRPRQLRRGLCRLAPCFSNFVLSFRFRYPLGRILFSRKRYPRACPRDDAQSINQGAIAIRLKAIALWFQLQLWCSPPDGPAHDGSEFDGAGAGVSQLDSSGAGAGSGAGATFGARFLAAFFGAAFAADFFAVLAPFAAFLAAFFGAFFADFFEAFFTLFFAIRSFFFFSFLAFFFFPLAILILLLPPINVHRAL
jgi:hypothetical protein